LFIKKTHPLWYQAGGLQNYHFKSNVSIGDFQRENALLVAVPPGDLLPLEKADHNVYGSDGTLRFAIFYTGNK
jgi:hypothetical protein